MDSSQARLALNLVAGLLADDPDGPTHAVDTFESMEDAAIAYAYLCGYLIETLASARDVAPIDALSEVRALIERDSSA